MQAHFHRFHGVSLIDLCDPNAKSLIVKECTELGFFKLANHGDSMEFLTKLEAETLNFKLSHQEKDMYGPPNPYGYGSKNIYPNDVCWIEYLLFCANSDQIFSNSKIPGISETLWSALKDIAFLVVEMMTEEMGLEDKAVPPLLHNYNISFSLYGLHIYNISFSP